MRALQRLPARPAALRDVQGAHAAGDNAIPAEGPLQAQDRGRKLLPIKSVWLEQ